MRGWRYSKSAYDSSHKSEPTVGPELNDTRPIVFVGNGRCYHTMDWFRTVRHLCGQRPVFLATDLIESEGHRRLIRPDDPVIQLLNVDWLLLNSQSRFGNVWRNVVKLLAVPIQVIRLKKLLRRWPAAVFHAHTMYYMFVCTLARIPFIGTPQGSEILVRPGRSRIYRHYARSSLRAAKVVTVDSVAMQDEIASMSGVHAEVVQNGIDVRNFLCAGRRSVVRDVVLSLRGMTTLYRIQEILRARAASRSQSNIIFIYPFWDETYRQMIRNSLLESDQDLGRLDKVEMTALLGRTLLAVSIPESDSSPRSVYEAVFAGACVAVTPARWVYELPQCMRNRIFVFNLSDMGWFDRAIEYARKVTCSTYVPSEDALAMLDQSKSLQIVVRRFYERT